MRGQKGPLIVRFAVDDQRSAWRQRECRALRHFLERLGRNDREGRKIAVHSRRYVVNRSGEQNFVPEPEQCLRQPFEQRHVGADENYFCHSVFTLGQTRRCVVCRFTSVIRLVKSPGGSDTMHTLRRGISRYISLIMNDSRMFRRMYATIGLMSSPAKLGMTRRNGARIGSLSR